MEKKECPYCGEKVSPKAIKCPHCHEDLTLTHLSEKELDKLNKWLLWGGLVLMIIGFFINRWLRAGKTPLDW